MEVLLSASTAARARDVSSVSVLCRQRCRGPYRQSCSRGRCSRISCERLTLRGQSLYPWCEPSLSVVTWYAGGLCLPASRQQHVHVPSTSGDVTDGAADRSCCMPRARVSGPGTKKDRGR